MAGAPYWKRPQEFPLASEKNHQARLTNGQSLYDAVEFRSTRERYDPRLAIWSEHADLALEGGQAGRSVSCDPRKQGLRLKRSVHGRRVAGHVRGLLGYESVERVVGIGARH
jgi:hypothetical protein